MKGPTVVGIRRRVYRLRERARLPRPRARSRADRVAFVLSGGGILGAIQIGQLKALVEAGVVPDLVIGTSVGALNAAAIAADPTLEGVAELERVWVGLRTEDLFPGNRVQRAWHLVRGGDHLYANDGLRRLVQLLPVETFEQLQRPLAVSAASLRTGRERWFTSGPLEPALLASTALPGIFPPVEIDGDRYTDGGVVNNVPLARAIEEGASEIYVLTCGAAKPAERPIRRPLDAFVQAVARTRAARVEEEIARYEGDARIHLLPVPEPGPIRYNDLTHTPRLIELGASATRAHLGAAAHAV